jgi:hypothetical protein
MEHDPEPGRLLSGDLPQSSPGDWDEGAALRETTLVSFPEQTTGALRHLLSELFGLYVEKGPGAEREPMPYTQLKAVELDLRHTARFLALIARQALRDFVSEEKDIRRGWLADRLAVQVEKIADEIAAELRPRKKKGAPTSSRPVPPSLEETAT